MHSEPQQIKKFSLSKAPTLSSQPSSPKPEESEEQKLAKKCELSLQQAFKSAGAKQKPLVI